MVVAFQLLTMQPRLVIETLQPLPKDRKCFRMIHGVLVEQTIQDVLPALQTNWEGLKQVLAEGVKQYKSKESEMNNWKVSTVASCPLLSGTLTHTTEKESYTGGAAVNVTFQS